MLRSALPWLLALSLPSFASAQRLMVCENNNDRVMLIDANDGSLIDPNWIDLRAHAGTQPGRPLEAVEAPNGEIYISDQEKDLIFHYSAGGDYLGESTVPLDNPRGIEVAYGSLWVCKGSVSQNGQGAYLVQMDMNMNVLATYTGVGDPFDAQKYFHNGVDGLLLTDIQNEQILFFDPANPGATIVLHSSNAVTSYEDAHQISVRPSNGRLLVTSGFDPAGIFEIDPVTGLQTQAVDTNAAFNYLWLNAAWELGNGRILYTRLGGVHVYDPQTGTQTTSVPAIAAQFISPLSDGCQSVNFCSPAAANSTGFPVSLSCSATGGNLHLDAFSGPPGEFGYFLVGTATQTMNPTPVGQGFLCLALGGGNALGRYNITGSTRNSLGQFDASGALQNWVGTSTTGLGFDIPSQLPFPGGPMISAGQTLHFQLWYRDTAAGSGQSNLSNGLSFTF